MVRATTTKFHQPTYPPVNKDASAAGAAMGDRFRCAKSVMGDWSPISNTKGREGGVEPARSRVRRLRPEDQLSLFGETTTELGGVCD